MPLRDFIAGEKKDPNLFWRLECGHHQNLLDEAIDALREIAKVDSNRYHGSGGRERDIAVAVLGVTYPTTGAVSEEER